MNDLRHRFGDFDYVSFGDEIVYDTGYIANNSGRTHFYTPGAYTGLDSFTGNIRISEQLIWGKKYHWHVRYLDSGGDWSEWSTDDPNPHQVFYTAEQSVPVISLSTDSIQFGSVNTSSSSTQPFTIYNTGNATLSVSSISSSNSSVFSVTPTSVSIPQGSNQVISLTFNPLSVQNYSETITITSNAGTKTIAISGTGASSAVSSITRLSLR